MRQRTLYDKLWDDHVVVPECEEHPAVLYVDLHLVHEVTSPQAFEALRERGLSVRRGARTLATMDHSIPTAPRTPDGRRDFVSEAAEAQVLALEQDCQAAGIGLLDMNSAANGIVHVVGPELGAVWPGMTVVCGDSHTSTHGAFGALAFGIGTTEVGHVLATQCLLQRKARSLAVLVDGELQTGVTAKDLALAVLAELGFDGGTGHALEYGGEAVRALSMEGRMTLCNLSIEAGARTGMIAPDERTLEYLAGRPKAPQGEEWDAAVAGWAQLASDANASFDRTLRIDAVSLEPRVTYGSRPDMNASIAEPVPPPTDEHHAAALEYMRVEAGSPLAGRKIDEVFIGSCTNSRIEDLRAAAGVLRGRKVQRRIRVLVVPGSRAVQRQAVEEGLAAVFTEAGCEWRDPGCSMCIAMNGDSAAPGHTVVSTSNRNFPGRQGPGARTFLASPLTAAAAAVTGELTDPRELLR